MSRSGPGEVGPITGAGMFQRIRRRFQQGKIKTLYLVVLALFFAGAYIWPTFAQQQPPAPAPTGTTTAQPAAEPMNNESSFHYFAPLSANSNFSPGEKAALWGSAIVALLALAYAGMLVKQVVNADQGTPKMQAIAAAVREGANA